MLCDARGESACNACAIKLLPGDHVWNVSAEEFVSRFQFPAFAQRAPELDLRAHNREQTLVVPRFRNEIARTAFHCLDREIDRRPRRHHHDRQRAVERLDFWNDFESLLARRGVARVIQVHHQQRVIALLKRIENSAYRSDRFGLVPLAFEQNPERFQHIALIIGNKNPAHRLTLNRESSILSMMTTVAAVYDRRINFRVCVV